MPASGSNNSTRGEMPRALALTAASLDNRRSTKLSDPWGHPYNYRFPGDHGEFDLYSYGAHADVAKNDEKPPIANW